MHKTFKQLKITFTTISLLVLLVVSFILFVAQIALAQSPDVRTGVETRQTTTTGTSSRPMLSERRAAFQTLRESFAAAQADHRATRAERIAEIQERRAENRAALTAAAQSRINTLADTAADRLIAEAEKLAAIVDRMQTYAETLSGQGVDVAAEVAALESVDALLEDALAALRGIDIDIEYIVTSDKPMTDWSEVRAQFVRIKDVLIEARQLLRETVVALKAKQ
ncbi:MAG: hypothetical protein WDZ93_02945 [Candidatus Paceibacterota bacterium]